LQLTPSDDLGGFGEHRFDLHPLNRIGGQLRFDHPAIQKVATSKSSIEMATAADLVQTLDLIKRAVEAGELGSQIDAVALRLNDGVGM
jgi:hypothetical protein